MEHRPKILLLVPPSFLYPLGSAYVAATMENASFDYDIYAFFYDNRAWFKENRSRAGREPGEKKEALANIPSSSSMEYLLDLIAKRQYEFILVGGLVGFFRWFYHLIPQIKGYSPKSKIIIGGGIAKDLSENILFENLNVDYVLKGEAETNLIELLSLLSLGKEDNGSLRKVPGLCWKDSTSAILKNSSVRFDIEHRNIRPAWDSFNIFEYIKLSDTLFRFDRTFFPILAGRGCPNICAFCSPSVGRFTPYPVSNVITEMKYWLGKFDFDFFFIYSEIAFNDEGFARDFCQRYIEEIGKPWVGQLRTDVKFSEDTYRLMKESGCMFMCLGFESANDRLLKIMRKRTTLNDHVRNIEQARKAGLPIFGNFMFGHESETAEEILETFDFLNRYDLIQGPSNGLASVITYPGTEYYRRAEKMGLVTDPFKFLLTYSMKAGISRVDIRELDDSARLNLSSLSNDDFYNTLCEANIQHRHLFWERHAAVEPERVFNFGIKAGFEFSGKCPICGNPVKFDADKFNNPLAISGLCEVCYYWVILDVYRFPEIQLYIEYISDILATSKKIVIYGDWIMDFLNCGAFPIPHDKFIAWVNPRDENCSNLKYFYHIPQIPKSKLEKHGYDTIVVLNSRSSSSLKQIEKDGLNPNAQLLFLFPDILNVEAVKNFHEKKIALLGHGANMEKIFCGIQQQHFTCSVDRFENVQNVCNASSEYDFLIFDEREIGVTRENIAQTTTFKIEQLLHTDHLLCCGLFSR